MEAYFRSLRDSIRKSKVVTRFTGKTTTDFDYKVWSLLESSFYGEKKTVKRLVEEGVDLNAKDIDENTAVHKAVTGNRSKVLRILLENSANCDEVNNNGETPLMIAIDNHLSECVEILLQYNGYINYKGKNNMSPLFVALLKYQTQEMSTNDEIHDNHEEVIENLRKIILLLIGILKTELPFEQLEYHKCLFFSVMHSINFAIQELITKAPNLLISMEGYRRYRFHVLHIAARNGNDVIVETLLNDTKVDINIESTTKWTPLHCAVESCCPSTVELLTSKGANCNAMNYLNETPLHTAIRNLSIEPKVYINVNKGTKFEGILKELPNLQECITMRLAVAVYLIKVTNADPLVRNTFGKMPSDLINIRDKEECLFVKSLLSELIEDRRNSAKEMQKQIKQLTEEKKELESKLICQICMDQYKIVVFQCGHGTCGQCVQQLEMCHICRVKITDIVKMY